MTSNGQVSGASLGGLAKTSLREQALDQLRNAVTSGEIAPGTRLVETELSAALGISRGTLREALRQLQQEGLVEAGDRGRLTVRTLTDAEILDMFEVRAALEGLAAAIVSARPDLVALVAKLQIALDALESARGSINHMVEVDLAFHRLLCELTGNITLVRTWEALAGSIRMSIMFAGTDRAVANMSVPRHQQVVDAIATGDPHIARNAVDDHMREALRQLQQEGLVEAGDRGRLTVRTLTDAEILDMFEVRAALEGLAAAIVSARPDLVALVAKLQVALDALESARGSINHMVEVDLAFHRLLCELTGNITLVRTWEALAGSIRMSIMFAGTDRAVANMSVPRHQQVVDAIATGDPHIARNAVDEHMREAAQNLLNRNQVEPRSA